MAGKTGTARKPSPRGGYEGYVATFAGFVPAENPQVSAIVVLDEPTKGYYGGQVAAPVFADVSRYALRLFRVPPPSVAPLEAPPTLATAGTVSRD